MSDLLYQLDRNNFKIIYDSDTPAGVAGQFNVQNCSSPTYLPYDSEYLDNAADYPTKYGLRFRIYGYGTWYDLPYNDITFSSTMTYAKWKEYQSGWGSGGAGWSIHKDTKRISIAFTGWDLNGSIYNRTGYYFSLLFPEGKLASWPYGNMSNSEENYIQFYDVDCEDLPTKFEVAWYVQPKVSCSPGASYDTVYGYDMTAVQPKAEDGYEIDYVEINGVKKTTGLENVYATKDGDDIYIHAAPNTAILKVEWKPEEGGSVSGGGSYAKGTNVSCTASPAAGYKFVKWDDGSVNPKRVITLTQDTSVCAYFAEDTVHVDLKVSPVGAGNTTGSGDYVRGSIGEINAIPNVGWKFVSWEPAHFLTPFVRVVMEEDWEQTAYFEEVVPVELTLKAVPTEGGVVVGGGSYYDGAQVPISATANPGYKFIGWSDGSTQASRTITIGTESRILTASFEEIPTHTITLVSNPQNSCTFIGAGKQPVDAEVVIRCIPNEGFAFLNWSDGSTDIERVIIADFDKTLTAFLEEKKDVTYKITANPFLYGEDKLPYARRIFDYIKEIRYIPAVVEGFDFGEGVLTNKKCTIRGHYDEGTIDYTMYIMKHAFNTADFSEVLESTGNENRQETSEISSELNEIYAKTNVFKRDLDETLSKLTDMEGNLSQISQRADEIEIKVEGKADNDGVKLISAINLAPDNIKISSKNVDIEGDFVTFSDLAGNGTTVINGANIQTGKISTDHIDAGSFTMTGGSINITTDSASQDKIKLVNGDNSASMAANRIYVGKTDASKYIRLNSDGTAEASGDVSANHFIVPAGNAFQSQPVAGSPRPLIWQGSTGTKIHLSNGTNADEVEVHGQLTLDELASLSTYTTLRINETSGHVGVSSSSARYKDNIMDNEYFDVYELINLPVREYTYKGQEEKHLGFIAEEVDEHFPVACRYNAEGLPETWEDRDIIPALLQLIQGLHKRVNILTDRINALEGEEDEDDRRPATGAWGSF